MKYYLGKVFERNAGFEYTTPYLFKTDEDPCEYAEKQVMGWRGGDADAWDENQEGYWSDCTLIFNDGYSEISEEEFTVMSKHSAVL